MESLPYVLMLQYKYQTFREELLTPLLLLERQESTFEMGRKSNSVCEKGVFEELFYDLGSLYGIKCFQFVLLQPCHPILPNT